MNSVTANKDRPRGSRLLRLVVLLARSERIVASLPDRAQADYGVIQCVPNVVRTARMPGHGGPFGRVQHLGAAHECGSGSTIGLRLDTGVEHGLDREWGWSGVALHGTGGDQFHDGERVRPLRKRRRFRSGLFQRRCTPRSTSSATARPPAALGNCVYQRYHVLQRATLFEIRLQCFKSPNCHSDWSYAWTTSFTAAVHDGSPPAIAAGGSLLSGAVVHGMQTLERHGDRRSAGAHAPSVYR